MTQLPAVLTAALRESAPRLAPAPPAVASARVQRGDLRFARALPGELIKPRLVLVLSVDSKLDFADVLLLHTATEMACNVDVVVPRSVSDVPYEVVVQTDLRGVVWTLQLGPAVGRLDDDVLRALRNETTSDDIGVRPNVRRGLQLAGPADPRWNFKRDEGVELRALARDCTDALLDEEAWQVEAGLLRPDLLDLADDPVVLVTELMHWLRTRTLELSPADVEVLLELGVLDTGAWEMFDDLGLDISTAVQSLVEAAATGSPRRADPPVSWRLVTATHIGVQERGSQPRSIRYLGQRKLTAA
jgi:hypothetical protein